MSQLSSLGVVDFWFAEETQPLWFAPTAEFDRLCANKFGDGIELAGSGKLDGWKTSAQGCLALILLLDQMTRNVYRGQARAFAYDAKALSLANHALAQGFDQELPNQRRMFIYLPLEHSENREDQARSVELFKALDNPLTLDYAIRHQVIIDRFGRFPHRNAIVGRESTAEELAFLQEPGSSF